MAQFLLTETDEEAQRAPVKANGSQLAAGFAKALILPFAALRTAAGAKQAAARAADFQLCCFSLAVGQRLSSAAAKQRLRAFIAEHMCLELLPWQHNAADKKAAEKFCAALPHISLTARENGLRGILLSCPSLASEKNSASAVFYARALQQIQKQGLKAGLLGPWQAPDIPRLLALKPDYLAFAAGAGRSCAVAPAFIAAQKQRLEKQAGRRESAGQVAVMDKILVSDFIVPMRIGAYAHEKTAAQRVCFNIIAETAPPATGKTTAMPRARGMADVFSYDIILDAIARMAAEDAIELVETAAENLAAFLLSYPQLERVTVRVEKLDLGPRAVGVEISRSKARRGKVK